MTTHRPHEAARPVCGAKTRSGLPCRQRPIAGRRRCRLHGGMSLPGGPDHPAWRHGRYSAAVPRGLGAALQAAAEDPELLSLRDEIAVLQVAIHDCLSALDYGTPVQISSIQEAAHRVRESRGQDGFDVALEALLGLCASIGRSPDRWREVADLAERKSRLVQAEHRRSAELEQMIPASRLYAMIEFISGVVRDVVKDRAVVVEISDRIRAVVDTPPDRRIDGVSE